MESFQDHYNLKEKPEIPCDFECPRCSGKIVHKQSDWTNIPDGYIMDWYICDNIGCKCSWIPNAIKEWNARTELERGRIRELREQFRILTMKLEVSIDDICRELDGLNADYSI